MPNQRDLNSPSHVSRPVRSRSTRKTSHVPKRIRTPLIMIAVFLCGFGINRTLAHLVKGPVVVAQAAPTSQTASLPSQSPQSTSPKVKKTSASTAGNSAPASAADDKTSAPAAAPATEDKVVTPPASAAKTSVIPCYTDDAFVIDYLSVSKPVDTHPLLSSLSKTDPSAVAVGGSGFGNISYWKSSVNSDTVGWLSIPGTNINYPVVQGPYTDYYTTKGYDKNYSHAGVIWASSECNVSGGSGSLSPNTVLFGHNWTNYGASPRIGNPGDTHFAQLTAFQHLEFAKNHQYIWFSTASQEMKWQIFAAFYTDINFNYISASGGSGIINGAIARSEHNYDVAVSSSDNILTLSTCTRRFGASNRQRFVVMAKLVSGSAPVANLTANPNPIRPNL